MNNHYIVERLGRQHITDALREAERARLVTLAEADRDRNLVQSKVKARGEVMSYAAGAREVPGL